MTILGAALMLRPRWQQIFLFNFGLEAHGFGVSSEKVPKLVVAFDPVLHRVHPGMVPIYLSAMPSQSGQARSESEKRKRKRRRTMIRNKGVTTVSPHADPGLNWEQYEAKPPLLVAEEVGNGPGKLPCQLQEQPTA